MLRWVLCLGVIYGRLIFVLSCFFIWLMGRLIVMVWVFVFVFFGYWVKEVLIGWCFFCGILIILILVIYVLGLLMSMFICWRSLILFVWMLICCWGRWVIFLYVFLLSIVWINVKSYFFGWSLWWGSFLMVIVMGCKLI